MLGSKQTYLSLLSVACVLILLGAGCSAKETKLLQKQVDRLESRVGYLEDLLDDYKDLLYRIDDIEEVSNNARDGIQSLCNELDRC